MKQTSPPGKEDLQGKALDSTPKPASFQPLLCGGVLCYAHRGPGLGVPLG